MRAALLCVCLPAVAVAVCSDEIHERSSCVGDNPSAEKTVSSLDECCLLCKDDNECMQWTYNSLTKECRTTSETAPVTSGLLHVLQTCGISPRTKPPTPPPTQGPTTPGVKDTWAVIAVGSSGYMNYRHHADGCHAYHVLIRAGVPPKQIIVMMEDDVANDSENPFKGKLFNKPGNNAIDVYAGCKIDYRGSVVTAKLFTSVITGDESGVPAGGKVLKSTSKDRVFLNFVDHGGVGLVAFPNGPPLHASELSVALKKMQSASMFSELLFYMEACESGSMFPDLTTDGKIFAVTAANGHESSWGYYCGSEAVVDGKDINSCLGDLFSISWMEDTDEGHGATESIKTQVERVTTRTSKSHVSTFGDKSFENEPIGNFQSSQVSAAPVAAPVVTSGSAVDVRDIPLYTARYRYEQAVTAQQKLDAFKALQSILESRKSDDTNFASMVSKMCAETNWAGCEQKLLTGNSVMQDPACHKHTAESIHSACPARLSRNPGGWNAYNMKYSQVMVNACEKRDFLGKSTLQLKTIVEETCVEATIQANSSAVSTQKEFVV